MRSSAVLRAAILLAMGLAAHGPGFAQAWVGLPLIPLERLQGLLFDVYQRFALAGLAQWTAPSML